MTVPVRVRLVRSGGFAGLRTTAQADTETLPREQGTELRGLVEAFEAADLPAAPARPRGADRFQYDLVVERGEERREARLYEPDLPAPARALVEWLLSRAERDRGLRGGR